VTVSSGVHVVFTQPVNQAGVPAQFAEHILGEVFLDSLAQPQGAAGADLFPAGPLPDFGLGGSSGGPCSSSSHKSLHGKSSGSKKLAGGVAGALSSSGGGGSSGGGSLSSGGGDSSLSGGSSGGSFNSGGGTSQETSGSTGTTQPASASTGFISTLKKPMWLLVAYLVWQGLMIGTGWGLWRWHRGVAS
jgi:hypothetical protein